MRMRKPRTGFSRGWMLASIVVFSVVEIAIGGYVAPVLSGRFVSHVMTLRLEVLMVLGSYFLGGFLVGFFSPTVRVVEPVAGAFVAAVLPFLMGVLSPSIFYVATTQRLAAAGALASFLAYLGADAGERACGALGNTDSAEYAKD